MDSAQGIDQFIGRRRELEALQAAHRSGRSEFIPIYGRRRVGKSALILEFLTGKTSIYHVGKRAPEALQIHEFLQGAAAALQEPLLASLPASDWRVALTAVVDRWKRREKLVIVLDEFQWTVEYSNGLPSFLQELWDRQWKSRRNVFLILCGSYIGFMEREVLGKKSPLFGRRTGQMLLKPFGYREASEFHPDYSLEERAKTYFLCGGIPLYLRHFTPDRSVEQNIAENLLTEFAPLFHEPDFLLREEFREVEKYYSILLAVAAGYTSNHAISQQTDIGERSLHYYLETLVDLGYLARRYPLTGDRPAARHVRFSLEDPLLRFWFRFIYPNTSYILQRGPQRALRDVIRPELDAYFGGCFERLCREALPRLYERENVSVSFDVGEYWDKSTQIDVVGLRDDGWTDLGECKWGPVRSVKELEAEMEDKVQHYPNRRHATIGRRVFTHGHVAPRRTRGSRIRWHSLDELFE